MAASAALALAGVMIGAPAAAAESCPVEGAAISWGFKESFRAYISGTIANGEWTVADGATYETPTFGFVDGAGQYDGASGAGSVEFEGAIRFTGHGGILDTTLSHPEVRFIDGGRAIIVLDVAGTTQAGDPVDATDVPFATVELAGAAALDGETIVIVDAPATLTAEGAAAFGTYPAGEALDPISITVPLEASCAALAPVPVAVWPFWLAGAGAALLAAAAVIVVTVRRRARTRS